MNSDSLPILASNVDKSQVPPIHQKRIVAFVNHFIINTVTCLNKLVVNCETKFIDFENKLHKVEASLLILEAKLSSVNGTTDDKPNVESNPSSRSSPASVVASQSTISTTSIPPLSTDTVDVKTETDNSPISAEQLENASNNPVVTPSTQGNQPNGIKACEDARYRKYFKMIQFGVPVPAVKQKMEAEGIDSHVLDEPNRILIDGVAPPPPEDN